MTLSEEDKKVIMTIHNSNLRGFPLVAGFNIPPHLLKCGLVSEGEEGFFISDDAKWQLVVNHNMQFPRLRR